MQRKTERPSGSGQESCDHDRLLAETLYEKTRRNRHYSVGDKKRERQKGSSRKSYVEAADDVGYDRPENVRQQ